MRRAVMVLGAALLALSSDGGAQEAPRVTVRVRQLAGASVYLDIGTRGGLATGDTVRIALDSLGTPVGALVVTASTETRSVLTFAGEPFPITRGDHLTLHLLREPLEIPADPRVAAVEGAATPSPRDTLSLRAPVAAGPERPAVPAPRGFVPPAHGRVALDLSTIRSVTTVGGADPLEVARTFATPALRFDVTAPRAVGGFTFHTSARVAYRYDDGGMVGPPTSARIYAASLERDFTTVPLRVMLGRFYSPVEQYSGVWDGAMVRVGRSFGLGALVGFEPDRWNERPSTKLPKVTAFVDGRARGAGWRWQGNLSAHTVRPTDAVPAHTFLGATQRITLGPLFLSHDVQVDQDPVDSAWRLSRLRVRASLDLSPAVSLRAGLVRRESYVLGRPGSPFAPRNDRVEGGLAVRAGAGYLSADGSVSKDVAGERSWGATGAFGTGPLSLPGGVGLSGSVSRWTGPYGNSVSAAPGLDVGLGDARLRFGYRFNRSDYLSRSVTSHGIDAFFDAPLRDALRVSARGRLQWGGYLRSQGLDLTLYRIF